MTVKRRMKPSLYPRGKGISKKLSDLPGVCSPGKNSRLRVMPLGALSSLYSPLLSRGDTEGDSPFTFQQKDKED